MPANEKPLWPCLARNLTGPELLERIRAGDDIALLPVGSMEMHGPQLPLGTDTFIAEAVCLMAAERMRGTVFDTISYSWPGSTKYSVPTISMTMEMETSYSRMVCDQLARCGFRRIYVVQFHGPGIALMRLAREFFEETGVPLAFYGLMRMPDNGRKECEEAGAAWEASLAFAAARYLGLEATFRSDADVSDAPPIPGAAALQAVQSSGALLGGLVTHPNQHGVFHGRIDADLGKAALRWMADRIASTAEAMAQYRDAWAKRDVAASYQPPGCQ